MSWTLRLLNRLAVAALVVTAFPAFSHADFIDVISQTYHINGSGAMRSTSSFSYDETSNAPLSRSDFLVVNSGGVSGLYSLTTNATGGVFASSTYVEATRTQVDIGDGFARGDADASITFRPLETRLILGVNAFGFIGPGFSGLYDDTAGAAVLQFGPFPLSAEFPVLVDLGHVYTLRASTDGKGFPGPSGARLSIASVPEPGSILTFLSMGLTVLVCLRFRRAHIDR